MVIPNEVIRVLNVMMNHCDANFCCKICGDVMSMEKLA
jgi:hypothetical protein